MRLFLTYIMILFCCLLLRTESKQAICKEKACTEISTQETQLSTELPALVGDKDWLKTYFFMMKVLNPVKQLDFPGDHNKSWNNLPCKLIHSARQVVMDLQMRVCYASKYMRLLSARHTNGFYIYSLRKLLV